MAPGAQTGGIDVETPPGVAERLLQNMLDQARAGTDVALERCVELLLGHPNVDYALLEVPPFDGEARAIERETDEPLVAKERPEAPRGVAATLRERGLAAVTSLPVGDGGAALTIGSREVAGLGDVTLAWCAAVASIFEATLHRRRLDAELLQAQRVHLTAELAAAIVHDVNNVFTGIVGFSSLLRSQLAADHAAQRHVQMIDSLSSSGHDLTRQLLDFARRSDGPAEQLNVNVVVREVLGLTSSVTGTEIDVAFEATDPLPAVRGELSLLRQAVTNLVLNAADAMPSGGRLVLRTRVVGSRLSDVQLPDGASVARRYVALDMTDTGDGIPAEVLPHIFKPFFTTKGAGSGTGLGLTSVRRIAERHGGSVDVKSTPSAGAVFTLWLPVAEN